MNKCWGTATNEYSAMDNEQFGPDFVLLPFSEQSAAYDIILAYIVTRNKSNAMVHPYDLRNISSSFYFYNLMCPSDPEVRKDALNDAANNTIKQGRQNIMSFRGDVIGRNEFGASHGTPGDCKSSDIH